MALLDVLLLAGLLVGVGVATTPPACQALPRLRVSEDDRYLVTDEGRPFFWLADTAWTIRAIQPEEVDLYLATRARQGFTVIQIAPATMMAHFGPDHAGRAAFVDGNTDAPNEAFWRNVDSIVDQAGDHGLYVVIFPLWGNDLPGAVGADAAKARRLGLWVGRRYASRSHVLWAVCGEYDSIVGPQRRWDLGDVAVWGRLGREFPLRGARAKAPERSGRDG